MFKNFPEIRWTEASETHIARHNVKPWEVEEALQPPTVATNGDDATIVVGRTYAGRYLTMVLTASADGLLFVVTAYDSPPDDRRIHSRRTR
ncbi:MAG: hypothetical protein J2P18_18745 [Nocardia sp.]|nr:hypothetical protein [Nocardia sp.]